MSYHEFIMKIIMTVLLSLGKTLKHALEKHVNTILQSGETTMTFNV